MTNILYDMESPELPSAEIIEKMEEVASHFVLCAPRTAEVCLTFLSQEEMRELNREHRGVDSVTDVLSFPQFEAEDLLDFRIEDVREAVCVKGTCGRERLNKPALLLGDIVICTECAREQAAEYGHSEEREFLYLFVHGMLHLLGYDHETEADKSVMREKEESIMKMIGCAIK